MNLFEKAKAKATEIRHKIKRINKYDQNNPEQNEKNIKKLKIIRMSMRSLALASGIISAVGAITQNFLLLFAANWVSINASDRADTITDEIANINTAKMAEKIVKKSTDDPEKIKSAQEVVEEVKNGGPKLVLPGKETQQMKQQEEPEEQEEQEEQTEKQGRRAA